MSTDGITRIYVASKSCHGPEWVALRDSWRTLGAPVEIISTWIDEPGDDEVADLTDLWRRCVNEASRCDLLIAKHHPDEVWKGAFIEIGAALAFGRPVYVIGDPPGSWTHHYGVSRAADVIDALRQFTERNRSEAEHVDGGDDAGTG